MVDLQQVQAELSSARRTRIAVETAGNEIEALVLDMQNHAWHRVALVTTNTTRICSSRRAKRGTSTHQR